ncbi:Oleosin [Zea mays]|uniref:Oleosin n=1 Tax=Zea mays TaxID=4577 RepID=A0A1D6JJC9_MAIZE|nr:Oleosin [Zea mays]
MAVAKALATATAAFSMLLLSGLAVTGTVLALIVATPLMVIFSPVLVPAAITVALLTVGIVSSGGFGVAAVAVLAWVYRYLQTTTSSSGRLQVPNCLHNKTLRY